jgi:hypothetical protein
MDATRIPPPKAHGGNARYGYEHSEQMVLDLCGGDLERATRIYGAVAGWLLNLPDGYYDQMGKPDAEAKFADLGNSVPRALQSRDWCKALIGDALGYVRLPNGGSDVDTQRRLIAEILD